MGWKGENLVNGLLVGIHPIFAALFKGCESSAPIVLRSTASLFIAKVLPGVGSEETFKILRSRQWSAPG